MNVVFPPEILRVGNKNREFIESLDKKLHYIEESEAETNISRTTHKVYVDNYTKEKLSKEELEGIISLIGRETGLVLTPINTNSGFSVGFEVLYTDCYGTKLSLLSFIEEQLPNGYDFKKLSETFNREDNIEMLVSGNLEKPEERWYYEY